MKSLCVGWLSVYVRKKELDTQGSRGALSVYKPLSRLAVCLHSQKELEMQSSRGALGVYLMKDLGNALLNAHARQIAGDVRQGALAAILWGMDRPLDHKRVDWRLPMAPTLPPAKIKIQGLGLASRGSSAIGSDIVAEMPDENVQTLLV